jgi:hypothetical protein
VPFELLDIHGLHSRRFTVEDVLIRLSAGGATETGGEGRLNALTYLLALEDAQRFRNSRDVGSYLGAAAGTALVGTGSRIRVDNGNCLSRLRQERG